MKRILLAALLALAPANAAETGACDGFAWPMAREKAAFEAATRATNPSGTTLADWPATAQKLSLHPDGDADFPLAPERAPDADSLGGYLILPAPPAPGDYQVTLDAKAWIDVVQDGAYVASGAHTSDRACALMRKSVRFTLTDAPVTLQLSGADATTVTFTIMPAAD